MVVGFFLGGYSNGGIFFLYICGVWKYTRHPKWGYLLSCCFFSLNVLSPFVFTRGFFFKINLAGKNTYIYICCMEKNTIDKLITLPKKIVKHLDASAKAGRSNTKNLMEKIIISYVEENIMPTPKKK